MNTTKQYVCKPTVPPVTIIGLCCEEVATFNPVRLTAETEKDR